MLYYVKPGDTLFGIARRFGTTVNAILNANVICNPNLIFVGQPLIIPTPGLELPKAGGRPYYVVLPGDTLYCLAAQFGTTVMVLAGINQLPDPNLIFAGAELLVIPNEIPDPVELKTEWEQMGGVPCEQIPGFTEYGVYYLGTFRWAALGHKAIPNLLDLLNHSCALVRLYSAEALGRIGLDDRVTAALSGLLNDPDPGVANMARLAVKRIELAEQQGKRVHVLITENRLIGDLNTGTPVTPLSAGTEIIVLRWHIPSPTGEEGPRGGVQIYDQVRVVRTGQIGFLPRFGLDQLTFI